MREASFHTNKAQTKDTQRCPLLAAGRHTEAPVAADFGSLWKVNTPPRRTVHVWLQFFLKQHNMQRMKG